MTFDIPPGSQFPDLEKAGLKRRLEDIVKGLMKDDKEVFQLAQDKKVELNKQRAIDLQSFWISQAGAIERGNSNSCNTKNLLDRVRDNQNKRVSPIVIPSPAKRNPYGVNKKQTKLPKRNTASPAKGNRSRPPSMTRVPVNQSLRPAIDPNKHLVDTVQPNQYPAKATRNMEKFAKAQAGDRGTSIGDRAVVFTANGTPMYGDSYLDKNNQENLAANQATSNLPVAQIPSGIQQGKPMSSAGLQQPKGDTTANLLVLGTVAAAVTAVLFLFQHILIFVELILQISSVTSTITNVAGSFVAILNNTGSLLGLGEGLIDPISSTFDTILNNVFGKEKVDYVKYQFAKISSAFVAGQNLINKVSGLNNTVGKVTETNANNTSIIGNAMKAMGMIGGNVPWMNEDNNVKAGIGKVGTALDTISGLSNSLAEISSDVKTQVQAQTDLDKQQQELETANKEGEKKATEKNSDKSIPEVAALGGNG
jgi:hypothetical protein